MRQKMCLGPALQHVTEGQFHFALSVNSSYHFSVNGVKPSHSEAPSQL